MKNLPRLLKIAAQRVARNPYHALAAFLVMFLTFFIVGSFALVILGSNALLSYFESRPQVTAFLKDDTSEETVGGIQKTLTETGVVSKTKYVSKEEALEIYKERNKNEPLLIEFVTADILPASLEVSTYKLDDLATVADTLRKNTAVEEVVFQQNIIETLSSWARTVRNVGAAVAIFLLITSILTTLIVIGLNISLHRDEIEIMKLVGATSWYIRLPFIFEGIFYGGFSALVATLTLWGSYSWVSPSIQKVFSDIPLLSATAETFGYLLIFEVFVGSLVGIIGSVVATRKYLSV
ncbi:MAG: permease-like cell division protein FtsX [Candidatus Woykebacteria bacterium]